jgi:hypothetical protein
VGRADRGEPGARISGVAVPLLAATALQAIVLQVSLLTLVGWAPYLVASQAGIRPALLVSSLGMWGAGLFVVFSPLRTMPDLPEPAVAR